MFWAPFWLREELDISVYTLFLGFFWGVLDRFRWVRAPKSTIFAYFGPVGGPDGRPAAGKKISAVGRKKNATFAKNFSKIFFTQKHLKMVSEAK